MVPELPGNRAGFASGTWIHASELPYSYCYGGSWSATKCFGVASNNAVTVNWSPAQSNQPVTSYTVTTITAGPAVAPVTVTPVAGSLFPADLGFD